jgi:hypothetical protein
MKVDDFLAAGHDRAELEQLCTEAEPWLAENAAPPVPVARYRATPAGLVRVKVGHVGGAVVETEELLTNFLATIEADVAEDDGAEVRRAFEMRATLGTRAQVFRVSATQFAAMHWPVEHLGAAAVVYPGQATREHARAAIQLLSQERGPIPERRVYTHLGWREVDGVWRYLHAGGAIGADGEVSTIKVLPPPALARFVLPEAPTATALCRAIRATLRLLDAAPRGVTVPLLAAVFRAAIDGADFGLHLAGPTGAGKTELSALAQQFFGPALDARNLAAHWSSTGNALEALAFAAKDALLAVDDFAPTGDRAHLARLQRDADRLFRAQGNASGRQRLRPDGSLVAARPPRGTILSTGEDIPAGQSLRARVLVLELGEEDVEWTQLTACQRVAADGSYARALAGFIRWLARDYPAARAALHRETLALRTAATASTPHRRTPDIVAHLAVGWRAFLTFAAAQGALEDTEVRGWWDAGWSALGEAAAAQAAHHTAAEPTRRFLDLLGSALASGRAHVATSAGGPPVTGAAAWGWRRDSLGTWRPLGERVAWLEGPELFLGPDAAYAVAQRLARDSNEALAVSGKTLHKRLHERGLLASTDGPRGTLTVRRVLDGARRTVLHLVAASLIQESDQSDQSAHEAPDTAPPLGKRGGAGQIPWADFGAANGESAHENLPTSPVPAPLAQRDGQIGQIGQVSVRETVARVVEEL